MTDNYLVATDKLSFATWEPSITFFTRANNEAVMHIAANGCISFPGGYPADEHAEKVMDILRKMPWTSHIGRTDPSEFGS
jgi:hypothetical protein